MPIPTSSWREFILIAIALLLLAGALSLPPLPQDPAYHVFAYQRALAGVPNFANVVSNLPFLVFGLLGLAVSVWRGSGARIGWATFFAGVALVSLGSGYYHLSPDNTALVWDRLPMTVAFMGLFVALIAEHMAPSLERYLLAPAVAAGILSIAWWHYADDLRLYGWVQFAPLLILPITLALFPGRYSHRRYLLYGFSWYVLAKIAEWYDSELFTATNGLLSGHTLKHLLASFSALAVYQMLARRRYLSR
jgi:hypothetical protein